MASTVVFSLLVVVAIIACVRWVHGLLRMTAYLRWLSRDYTEDDIR